MSNQPYLSAEALAITSEEHAALIAVKSFLATIENPKDLRSVRDHSLSEASQSLPAKFNMNQSLAVFDCGTACCIGGWMKLQMAEVELAANVQVPYEIACSVRNYVYERTGALHRLFFPRNLDYDSITPTDAVAQIELFLTTGTTNW